MDGFKEYIETVKANGNKLECPFGCSAYGVLCNGNPYETPCGRAIEVAEREEEMDHEQKRCADCFYLVEGNNGEWICDDCQKEIHDIPDDECSAEQNW